MASGALRRCSSAAATVEPSHHPSDIAVVEERGLVLAGAPCLLGSPARVRDRRRCYAAPGLMHLTKIVPLLIACAIVPVPRVVRAEAPTTQSPQALRDRAAKLEADAAVDRATADKGRKTAVLARKTATEKAAAAAKLRAQLSTITDAKAKAKAQADADALDKEAARNEDDAVQAEAAAAALDRRAKKLEVEAKRLRKQAAALEGGK